MLHVAPTGGVPLMLLRNSCRFSCREGALSRGIVERTERASCHLRPLKIIPRPLRASRSSVAAEPSDLRL
ncbi:hypothetical protein Y032_0004g1815 [Ancylostoma ceylanicum]|uniref:Uncharacterized protein n=1 Tax=Ancylostoma ceylanicum TaxID=53326 RepID=A0A016VU51_9BILA|nr:hypothetical protein Y032_0004g1815 [Ancylostoma ceylanicum]